MIWINTKPEHDGPEPLPQALQALASLACVYATRIGCECDLVPKDEDMKCPLCRAEHWLRELGFKEEHA